MNEVVSEPQREAREVAFLRRVLIVAAIVVIGFLAWHLSGVLMLAFGAIVMAVVLRALADFIARHSFVPERWSLTVGIVLLTLVVLLVLGLFGAQISAQFGRLSEQLPAAFDRLRDRFAPERELLAPLFQGQGGGTGIAGRLAAFGAAAVNGIGNLVLILIAAIFLAADPKPYRRGFVKLLPHSQQARVDETFDHAGKALRLWLLGTLVSMAMVAALTTLGLWIVGVPAPLAIGLVAGLAEFVPFIGPFAAGVVALLAASTMGLTTVAWTVLVILLIQQIESNMIAPLVQQRAVSIPAAMSLFAIAAFGTLFGILGVIFGMPLAVVVMVAVQKLYVRETLGEATTLPGEKAE